MIICMLLLFKQHGKTFQLQRAYCGNGVVLLLLIPTISHLRLRHILLISDKMNEILIFFVNKELRFINFVVKTPNRD